MDKQIPIILIENKVDLEELRVVHRDEGVALTRSWGVPYMETSAKTKQNIDKVFYDLVITVKDRKNAQTGGGQKKRREIVSSCRLIA